MILLALLLACEGTEPPASCTPRPGEMLFVSSTDWTTGAISALSLEDGELLDPAAPAGGDPMVVALDDGSVALLERGGGHHLRIYEPGCWSRPRLEVALGDANPHDAVLHDGLLWLSLYERSVVWALDPEDGSLVLQLDLSAEADADGLPEADRFVRHGDRLFLGLQRFERPAWTSGEGRVVEIDAGGIRASHPVGPSPDLFAGSEGLIVRTGTWGSLDGSLSVLDPDDGSSTELITEAEAGFDFIRYVETDTHGVLIGAEGDGSGRVLCRDLATDTWVEGPSDPGWMVDAVAAGERVWVGVRSGWGGPGVQPGLKRLDPHLCEWNHVVTLLLEPYALAPGSGTTATSTVYP